jgi:glycerophosphoryl diester phosphodiesterase
MTAGAVLLLATGASAVASPEIVGHRGGMDAGPENALDTFRHAVAVGTDAVEFDVRFTKDAVAVISHDATVNRMTNCSGAVNSFTLARLQLCNINVRAGQPRQAIPTLDQTLAVLAPSKIKIYVHVKEGSLTQAKKIVSLLNKYKLNTTSSYKNRTVVFADSSNKTALKSIKTAGAKRRGIIFNSAKGWTSPYPVIIAYGTPVTRALVAKAQKAGKFVVAVENHPVRQSQVAALGLNGFMAEDLDGYLVRVGRLEDPKITAARVAAAAKAAAEKAAADKAAADKAAADKAAAEKAAADKAAADKAAADKAAADKAEADRLAAEEEAKNNPPVGTTSQQQAAPADQAQPDQAPVEQAAGA